MQKILSTIRNVTPLAWRQRVGPILAYVVYVYNVYINPFKKVPHVLTIEQTIRKIINKELSVVRFGDGEISLIDSNDLAFQKKNNELSSKLKKILQSDLEGLLVCVPGFFGKLDNLKIVPFRFTLHHLFKHGHVWKKLLSSNQIYGDAFITRPHIGFKDQSKSGNNFIKLFSIWEGKDVVLIEGEKSRLGVGNDMFDKAKSLRRILCPAENAFLKYEEIKKEALKIDKENLILISLGPTAKVLAYDMFLLGYRVIDIGHIDMEYEMFLRKETKLTKVPYKYFNEINERNPEDCTDEKYLKQVVTTIK